MKRLSVLHQVALTFLLTGVFVLAAAAQSDVAQVNTLRLEKTDNSAKYVIGQTGTVEHQDFLLANPARLVVDFVGARHGLEKNRYDGDGKLVKGVRTSQFTADPNEVTRVVFDLAEGTKYKVTRNGSTVEVDFFRGEPVEAKSDDKVMQASFGTAWDPAAGEVEPAVAQKAEDTWPGTTKSLVPVVDQEKLSTDEVMAMNTAATGTQWPKPKSETTLPTTESAIPDTETHIGASWAQGRQSDLAWNNFVRQGVGVTSKASMLQNRKITMDVQSSDIKTVLRAISEFSGANIVAGPEVEGPVTVHLVEVPWKEALDVILKANSYGIREEYGIIRVQTLETLNDEEIDIATVVKQKEDLEPLVSRVIKLNYVNAKEMQSAMKDVTTKRGSIQYERDNNAVIINDIPKVADRIAEMVVGLDTRVNQVEIIAKMVDIDVEATREIGVQWDALNIMSADINGNADIVTGKDITDPFGTMRVGTINSWGDVTSTIQALERENKADIISNPRITTTDNKEANILVGKEIPLIVTDEAGNPITELKKIGITLRVTPHVNSDMTITMDLHPEISELSAQATVQGGVIISVSEADTRVVVANGETAVIAGLINEVETKIANGVPVLKDVPILGNLFKFENSTKKKRELVIFVTPRIVGEFVKGQMPGE